MQVFRDMEEKQMCGLEIANDTAFVRFAKLRDSKNRQYPNKPIYVRGLRVKRKSQTIIFRIRKPKRRG